MAATPSRAPATAMKVGSPREWLTAEDRARVQRKEFPHSLSVFAWHYAFYYLTLFCALAPLSLAVNIIAAIANGMAITYMFIIGHDCMHGAFAPTRRANQILGRLAFIPCAFSPSLWVEGHNVIHHGKTNLRGYDFAWTPMDPGSFAAASPLRRRLERIYRHPLGHGLYTLIEVWLKRLIFPLTQDMRQNWRRHIPDGVFVIIALALTIAGVLAAGKALTPERGLLTVFLLGWALPFAVWCHLFGVSSYLQHTHPNIRWYDDPAEWTFFKGAIQATADVQLPANIGLGLLRDAMAHTAHHALPSVPIYLLKEGQRKLNERYRGDITSFVLTLSEYRRILKTCKLYNYKKHYWTDFDGRQTGPSLGIDDQPIPIPSVEASQAASVA